MMMMTQRRQRMSLSTRAGLSAGVILVALCATTGCGMSGAQQRAMSRAGHRIEAGRNEDRSVARAFRLDEFAPNSTAVASANGDRP